MFLGFLLPACLAVLLFDLVRRWRPDLGLREILLVDALLCGVLVVLGTETLSLLGGITTMGAIDFWVVACLVAYFLRRRFAAPAPLSLGNRLRRLWKQSRWDTRVMLAIALVFALTLLLIGLAATPNNYDSMTYHLARVAHWMQNRSIAFYGTNIPRQNYMPPWSEWAMLQLALLQGSDRLVNTVQWLSLIGCVAVASLITELLGGQWRDGVVAAFFVITLPGAIFEATTTQNDLVMSLWWARFMAASRRRASPDGSAR